MERTFRIHMEREIRRLRSDRENINCNLGPNLRHFVKLIMTITIKASHTNIANNKGLYS